MMHSAASGRNRAGLKMTPIVSLCFAGYGRGSGSGNCFGNRKGARQ